jgi:1,4-alpha-glucan branching enzyme
MHVGSYTHIECTAEPLYDVFKRRKNMKVTHVELMAHRSD